MITAADIFEHIKSVGTWVDWNKTTDKITWGNPGKEISKMVIAWMATNDVLRQSLDWGADAGIFTDELNYWSSVYCAKDVGLSCILVPHSVSEAFGMESKANYFEKQFPQIEIKFCPQGTPHNSVSVDA